MSNECKTCTDNKVKRVSGGSSILSVLLIVILPKCPICIMAYTSAVTICGGPDMYMQENNWVSYVPIILAMVILGLILYNRKGYKTYISLIIGSVGAVMIILTHQLLLAPDFYKLGTILLFVAIWVNSNFFSFWNLVTDLIKNRLLLWRS